MEIEKDDGESERKNEIEKADGENERENGDRERGWREREKEWG